MTNSYAFDVYALACLRIRADSLEEARQILAHKAQGIECDTVTEDGIEIGELSYRGTLAVPWVEEAGREIAAEDDGRYNTNGWRQLERLATNAPELPMSFRVVQVSPDGEDMETLSASNLDGLMGYGAVVRVGANRQVCEDVSVNCPQALVGDDGELTVSAQGWVPVAGFSKTGDSSVVLHDEDEFIGDGLAGRILSKPGLYGRTFAGEDSWVVLHKDDTEQLIANAT